MTLLVDIYKDDEISKQYISSNLAKKEDDTTGQYQV